MKNIELSRKIYCEKLFKYTTDDESILSWSPGRYNKYNANYILNALYFLPFLKYTSFFVLFNH